MNYPAAELRGIKMNFYLINPDAEHRGILLIKQLEKFANAITLKITGTEFGEAVFRVLVHFVVRSFLFSHFTNKNSYVSQA